MENRSHAFLAGLFVLILGAAALIAAWWLSQRDTLTQRLVIETRKNVTGLNPQAQVRYRGIRAGKVESIAQDPADPRLILVTVAIDERFKLSRGSTAQLGYQGFTGLAYVQIEDNGQDPTPLASSDDRLPRLPMKEGAMDTLTERAGDIVGKLAQSAERLQRVMDDKNISNIATTLDNVAAGSAALRELPAIVAGVRETLAPANIQRLQRIADNVEKISGEAAPLTAELRQLVTSLTALSQRAASLTESAGATSGRLQAETLPQAEQLMRELRASARQLKQFVERLEREPQMFLTGPTAPLPGPGEPGFVAPAPLNSGDH